MSRIRIIFGPKRYFKTFIPEQCEYITLTELAIKSDAKRREHIHKVEGQEIKELIEDEIEVISNLVVFSDEYSGISDHAIQNFIGFLSQFEISNIEKTICYLIKEITDRFGVWMFRLYMKC